MFSSHVFNTDQEWLAVFSERRMSVATLAASAGRASAIAQTSYLSPEKPASYAAISIWRSHNLTLLKFSWGNCGMRRPRELAASTERPWSVECPRGRYSAWRVGSPKYALIAQAGATLIKPGCSSPSAEARHTACSRRYYMPTGFPSAYFHHQGAVYFEAHFLKSP